MNNNPALGTLWKGRILLSLEAYSQDNPKLSIATKPEPLSENLLEQYIKHSKENLYEWCIIIELYFGLSFPSKEKSYEIEVRWADQSLVFQKTNPKGNLWEWYCRQKMRCLFPYNKFEDLPDVFIYLKEGDNRLCFIRKTAAYFIDRFMEKPEILLFKPELSKNPDFKFHEAGLVKLRCAISLTDFFTDFDIGNWNKPLAKPEMKTIFLFANVFHGKNLIPADSDGNSDPYYSIEYYGCEEKSEVIEDSLNPVYEFYQNKI